jgi:formylglycine-generating enzyme required for sulfatase activity
MGLENERGATPAEKERNSPEKVYPWGSYFPPKPGDGNYDIDGVEDGYDGTAPVMSFKANKLGVYDLGGNVYEWCQDWYDEDKDSRVLRGASWDYDTEARLRSSSRYFGDPRGRVDFGGFRCVLVVAGG